MYILLAINFLFTGFIGVFFYNQLKDLEDDVEEIYDLFYKKEEEEKNIKKRGKVVKYDRSIF